MTRNSFERGKNGLHHSFCVLNLLFFFGRQRASPYDLCCMASDIRMQRFNIDPFLLTLRSTTLKLAQCQSHLWIGYIVSSVVLKRLVTMILLRRKEIGG